MMAGTRVGVGGVGGAVLACTVGACRTTDMAVGACCNGTVNQNIEPRPTLDVTPICVDIVFVC